jgi:uncharacterized protein YbbK (DUF523 family)
MANSTFTANRFKHIILKEKSPSACDYGQYYEGYPHGCQAYQQNILAC